MSTNHSAPPPLPPNAALRYDVVSRYLEEIRPATVLEIGCGQGSFGARLARRASYLGVEPALASWQVAAPRIEQAGGKVINGDHTAVPDGTTYDLVCAFEVLEHIEGDKEALTDWVRYVRPGGHLMLSVPAWQDRFGSWDELAGHFRRYSPAELEGRLHDVGLRDTRVVVYGWPLGIALEGVRNLVASRREVRTSQMSYQERTEGSGRLLQPNALAGTLSRAGVAPFRLLQRLQPTRGTGLVALAHRPPTD
jgi:2-polyprenyl-3-methyl-5-hydroxy-6-metoxy-1,4-benzoquinol methylase